LPDPLRYVRALAEEIGPRGATTAAEARAARYIAEAARGYTHQVWLEPFRSFASPALPWLLILGLCAAGGFFLWFSPGLGATLCTVGAVSYAGQGLGWIQLGWLLQRRQSQNVVSVVPARETIRRRLVIVAHYDTGRRIRTWLGPGEWQVAVLAATASVIALPLIAIIYGTEGDDGSLKLALIPWLVVCAACAALILWERHAPQDAGIAEGAAGVAVALSAGEALARAGLNHTEVWVVCTGCRTTGMVGFHALLERHGTMLADASFLVLDRFGAGRLSYVLKEGLLDPCPADAGMAGLVCEMAAAHPEWDLQPATLSRRQTQAALAQDLGLAALALRTAGPGASARGPLDLADVRPKNLYHSVQLIRALARRIDQEAGEEAIS
jgi:hypothetical protein